MGGYKKKKKKKKKEKKKRKKRKRKTREKKKKKRRKEEEEEEKIKINRLMLSELPPFKNNCCRILHHSKHTTELNLLPFEH